MFQKLFFLLLLVCVVFFTGCSSWHGSAELDGESQYMMLPSLAQAPTENFTIETWFKANTNHTKMILLGASANNTSANFQLALNIDTMYNTEPGSIYFELRDEQENVIAVATNKEPGYTVGVWHHLAVIKSGDAARLYLDQEPLATYTYRNYGVNSGPQSTQTTNSLMFETGGVQTTALLLPLTYGAYERVETTRYFNGSVYGLRVWDSALSNEQLEEVSTRQYERPIQGTIGAYQLQKNQPVNAVNTATGVYVNEPKIRRSIPDAVIE